MTNELTILSNWEKAKNAIAVCKNIDEVKIIRDKAEAMRAYAKQAKEGLQVQNQIAEIKLRCERKIGELSKELPKATGNQYALSNDFTKQNTLAEMGFSRQVANNFEKMASLSDEDFEKHIEEVKQSNKELTTVGLVKLAKQLEREENIETQKEEIKNIKPINGKYDVLVLDPPWDYGRKYDPETSRVANPYPEMSIEEIRNIELPDKEDSILWLWTTHKFMFEAYALLEHWEYEHKATLVWNKEAMGMGSWLRMQCEFCFLAVKGKPKYTNTKYRDIISESRREHSRKPDLFYKMVDDTCYGSKLDYFSRERRAGWDVFGNDKDKFNVER